MKNFKPIGIIVNKYQMGTGKNGIQSSEKEYRGVLPFEEIVVFPTQREQRNLAARRMEQATTSYQDFSRAQDVDPDKRAEFTRKAKNPSLRNNVFDCLNTSTRMVTNDSTVAKTMSLYSDPGKFRYTRLHPDYVERGDIIYYNRINGLPYHAGMVLKRTEHQTQVRSSNGSGILNPIRQYDRYGNLVGHPTAENIRSSTYYRYDYPYHGVYFKQNGKLNKYD